MPVEDLYPATYDIPADGYFVSTTGSVWSNKSGKMKRLATYECKDGYLRCCLTINNKQHRVPVHRLVATTFHGFRPEGKVCRHIDGDKKNNASWNLCWDTQAKNIEDQRTHGTMYQGQRHHLAHVKDEVVRTVRVMYANGCTQKHISKTLGISKYSVCNYVHGKTRRSAGCL